MSLHPAAWLPKEINGRIVEKGLEVTLKVLYLTPHWWQCSLKRASDRNSRDALIQAAFSKLCQFLVSFFIDGP